MIRNGLCYRLATEMYLNDCSLAQACFTYGFETEACFTYGFETDYLSDAEIGYIYELVKDFEWDWP